MTIRNLKSIALAVACLALSTSSLHADEPASAGYVVKDPIHIGGEGRWDYVTVDSPAHLLYVTRSTHTQVIDAQTGKVVLDVAGQQRNHGAVAVTAAGRGFITDGKAGTIVIFDLKTGEVLGSATAAEDADGIVYDAGSNKVLATCGDAGVLAVLDPTADPKAAKADTVDLAGKPEFLAADGNGTAYVCVNDKNEIAAVDLKAMKVTARYPTGTGTAPTGIAIDAKNGRLFVGCRNQKLIVMNTADGKVLGELPIGKGNDACGFNPTTGEAFASCGDGTLTVAKETAPGKFEVTQTVKTAPGARTMTVDPATNTIYLPTAEFDPATAGQRRPAPKPDTFMLVVVAPAAK
jgi:DNA-binding beta-propeller fold protein YncE